MKMDAKFAYLIGEITPIYNDYRIRIDNAPPYVLIELSWEIGDKIKMFISQNSIKPHTLYREIYGMSEGSVNIQRKSWISREFLGRCLRIREIFISKLDIKDQLSNLKQFSFFRESMPFFDNPKYVMIGEDKVNLLRILNSSNTTLKTIRQLLKQKIGIKNSRNQRLADLEHEKDTFINFYNYILKIVNLQDDEILDILKKNYIEDEFLNLLAKNTNSCTQDGLKYYSFDIPNDITDKHWIAYANILIKFSNENNSKLIRRFRRLVPPERLTKLSEMLNELLAILRKNIP